MSPPKTPKGEPSYHVGRGKPPKHSQFKPGQSGNAGGRKKGVPSLRTIVSEVMTKQIEFTENGKTRKASVIEATVLRLARLALEGNPRAITTFLELGARHAEPENANQAELPHEDRAILETFRTAMSNHRGPVKSSESTDPAPDVPLSSRKKPRRTAQ
jgi:hypothetical protein